MNRLDYSVSELLFDCFLSRRKVYCYGATREASLFIDRYPAFFDGLIDRQYSPGSDWNGLECLDPGEIDNDSVVINCVTAANAWGVDQALSTKTGLVLHVFDLLSLLSDNNQFDIDGLSPMIRDWVRFPSLFLRNIRFYERLSACFADTTSRRVYQDYLDARICGDILILGKDKSFCDPATMYLQPFLPSLENHVFLDIGAFDGQNSLAFLDRHPDARAICVEPEPANVDVIAGTLSNHRDRSMIVQTLLGDTHGEFDIEPNGSDTARIECVSASSIRVMQKTLNDIFDEYSLGDQKVFLKIDVEGSEAEILRGASRFLQGADNILALSCYHKSDDLESLWPLIERFAAGRRVHFRHLTTGACETVLFVS